MQQFNYWEDYFDNVGTDPSKSNELGLLTNMFTIGSIISMFIVYVPRRLVTGIQPGENVIGPRSLTYAPALLSPIGGDVSLPSLLAVFSWFSVVS